MAVCVMTDADANEDENERERERTPVTTLQLKRQKRPLFQHAFRLGRAPTPTSLTVTPACAEQKRRAQQSGGAVKD
eukprot:1490213-Rhodomonas_salina.1